jgi:hypothetical protein
MLPSAGSQTGCLRDELDDSPALFPSSRTTARRTLRTIEESAMNTALKTFSLQPRRAPEMTIDWEMQPSLQHLVKRSDGSPQDVPNWTETMPVPFEAMPEPVTFCEPLEGLSMRDLDEPEIFRVFFGETPAVGARA